MSFNFGASSGIPSGGTSTAPPLITISGAPNFNFGTNPSVQSTTTNMQPSTTFPSFSSSLGIPNTTGATAQLPTNFSSTVGGLGSGGGGGGGGLIGSGISLGNAMPLPTCTPTTSITFASHPFQYIQECFDPNSPNFCFRFFFYNLIPGGMLRNPQSRPPLVSEQLWTQTINDNPNPSELVPVLANGFDDLMARRTWQEDHQVAQRTKLTELDTHISNLLTRQDLDVTTQLQVIQRQQLTLILRILSLMRRVEIMRKAGVRMTAGEQNLLARVQALGERLQQRPLHTGGIKQMEGQVGRLAEMRQLDPLNGIREYQLRDGPSLECLQTALKKERDGLSVLIEALTCANKDLEVMRNGYS